MRPFETLRHERRDNWKPHSRLRHVRFRVRGWGQERGRNIHRDICGAGRTFMARGAGEGLCVPFGLEAQPNVPLPGAKLLLHVGSRLRWMSVMISQGLVNCTRDRIIEPFYY